MRDLERIPSPGGGGELNAVNPGAMTLINAGRISYLDGLHLQDMTHAQVLRGERPPTLILAEHPPVITLGKHADSAFLLASTAELRERHVDVVRTERGGEITAHMPGQLIAYPIIKFNTNGLTPKRYVSALEQAVIEVLAQYAVTANRDPAYPGVWVDREKIAAIGIRIKDRVSLHGLALNVDNDLSLFSCIVPCGIQNRGVTSLARLLGRRIDCDEVAPRLVRALRAALADA